MNKGMFLFAVTVCIVFLAFLQPSYGAYVWVDDKGVTHMTDYPKPINKPEQQEEEPGSSGVLTKKDVAPIEVKQDLEQASAPTPLLPKTAPFPVSAVRPSPAVEQSVKTPAAVPPVTPQQVGQAPITSPPGTSPQPIPLQQRPDLKQEPRSGQHLPAMVHRTQPTIDPKFMAGLMIVLAVLYVYGSFCLYLIARKLDVPAAWTAWVPIVQIWTFLSSAGKSLVWVLLLLVPLVNAVVSAYLWMCITENLGKNKWLGLLMLLPVVNLVYLGVLAFSAREA